MNGQPTSHFLRLDRRRLHYVDWGNAAAPTLLMVHGGRDHCRSWDWLAQELCAEFHVVAVDLAGHGDSDWLNDGLYSGTILVADLAALIATLGPDPIDILAHSMGGMMALRFTGLYPERVRRFCAIEGLSIAPRFLAKILAVPIDVRFRQFLDNRRQVAERGHRRYATIGEAVERMRGEHPFLSEAQADHLTRHGLRPNDDLSYSWKFDPYLRVMPFEDMPLTDLQTLWSRITCPLLMIYGSDSGASDPRADGRGAFLPGASFVTIEGAKHWVHHDHFDAVLGLVRDFLRQG